MEPTVANVCNSTTQSNALNAYQRARTNVYTNVVMNETKAFVDIHIYVYAQMNPGVVDVRYRVKISSSLTVHWFE